MADFTSVLDRNFDEIEKPKPIPTGTYYGQLVGVPKERQVGPEKKPVIDFNIKLTNAKVLDDPSALDTYDLPGARPVQKSFFVDTDEGVFALKQFLSSTLGITGQGRKMKELMAESVGKQLLVTVGHDVYQNQSGEMEIASRAKAVAPV